MPVLNVVLTYEELDALKKLAQLERRIPRQQAAILIHASLEGQGYLKAKEPQQIEPQMIGEPQRDCADQ